MTKHWIGFLVITLAITSCEKSQSPEELKKMITEEFSKQPGTFAVAFKDLTTGEEILINEQYPLNNDKNSTFCFPHTKDESKMIKIANVEIICNLCIHKINSNPIIKWKTVWIGMMR